MKKLLDRLISCDVEIYNLIDREIGIDNIKWENIGQPDCSSFDCLSEDRILWIIYGILHKAIMSRHWSLEIETGYNSRDVCVSCATITTRDGCEHFECLRDTPTEAVLLAYVQILKG